MLVLAACSSGDGEWDRAAGALPVECALGGAATFAEDCTMERAQGDGESLLVLRHPDGGFRRFELGVPGRGLITADGQEQAQVTAEGDRVEIRVGADRYRLPLAR